MSWNVLENSTPSSHADTICHFHADLFMMPQIPEFITYCCLTCGLKCRSSLGLTQHQKAKHLKISAPKEAMQQKRIHHPHLTGDATTHNSLQLAFFFSRSLYMSLSQFNHLMLHLITLGLHSQIGSHLTGLNTTLCAFSHQKVKSLRVLTFGVLLSSNMHLSIAPMAMYLGVTCRTFTRHSTLYRPVLLAGRPTSSAILDQDHKHCLNGCWRHMN
jgi:hypothetical protein